MIPIVWDILFLPITIVLVFVLVTIIKKWLIRVKPVAWDIVSVYASTGSTLVFIVAIYGIIQRAVEWDLVDCMFLIIAIISVSMLICLITKRLDRNVEDLGVAAVKLNGMKTALHRHDSLPYSKQCNRWLENEVDLQRKIELVYHGCGGNYSRRFNMVSWKAGQMLSRANDLLVQGVNLLHPKDQLRGTIKFYKKMVINFIENPKSELLGIWGSGGVGKTSLLKLVSDSRSEYDDDRSLMVMFVRAGTGCTVGQVQEAIATSIGLPLERHQSNRAQIIRDRLTGKSFLLLLDDLWEYLDLEAVGIPWPLGTIQGGSVGQTLGKVVLTTRRQAVCIQMGCRGNAIKMKCFDEQDAWKLFHRGWSLFSGVVAAKPEQKLARRGRARMQTSKPQPDTASDVQGDVGLPGGMTDYYEKVCSFIAAKSEVLMGIWGMRGVGKTTLLRLVHDTYTAADCFDHIMLVGAGTGEVVSNVQHAIAINLGLDWGMMSSLDELSRGEHICDHLRHKSFLLLLDDIRAPLNWWAIGLPMLSPRQKIILATRSEAACALMGCSNVNTVEMRCLGEYDAWKLFKDKVELDDCPQLHHLAEQVCFPPSDSCAFLEKYPD
jgi:hypothetical protein